MGLGEESLHREAQTGESSGRKIGDVLCCRENALEGSVFFET